MWTLKEAINIRLRSNRVPHGPRHVLAFRQVRDFYFRHREPLLDGLFRYERLLLKLEQAANLGRLAPFWTEYMSIMIEDCARDWVSLHAGNMQPEEFDVNDVWGVDRLDREGGSLPFEMDDMEEEEIESRANVLEY